MTIGRRSLLPGVLGVVGALVGCGSGDRIAASGQGVAGSATSTATPPTPNHGCGADGDCTQPAPVPPPWQDECNLDGGTTPPTPPPTTTCGFSQYNDGLVGGQISDVAYDARAPGVAWAAAGPRLYKSTDSGATWTMVYEGNVFGFRKLALPSGDPKVLLAATSSGVARSEDGGVTWTVRGMSGISVSAIVVHPAEPLRVYAAIRGAGMMRSNDGGKTWGSVDYGIPFGEFVSMTADPSNHDIVTVVVWELDAVNSPNRSRLMRTTNGGVSWTTVQEADKTLFWEVETCAADPNVVYAAATNYYQGLTGILRSNDRGVTWTVTNGLKGKLATTVAVSPSDCNTIYAVHYDLGLKQSTDGGETFSAPLRTGIPFYNKFPRHVSVDPANSSRLLGASHGGVLFSTDAGQNFAVVGGVMNLAIRGLSSSPTDPDRLWMATWGSGTWQRADGSSSWARTALNVDYNFTVAADPVVPGRTLLGTWSFPYLTTNGVDFTAMSPGKNPFAFAFDPSSTSTLYMATQIDGLYKSTDNGTTWVRSNGTLTGWATGSGVPFIDMRSVLVDKNASNRILIGTNSHGIYRSEDGGVTLQPVAPLLSEKLVSCLVQGAAAGEFYACVDGSGVAKSTDNGATFAYSNTGLPSLNVAGMTADGANLYSTSNFGVFKSTDGAATWQPFGDSCLPADGAGVITTLGTGATRKLVVGTGRGVFARAL